jgi:CRP/FNR family transcriptional regulator, cyclic AMP receptor protein
MSIDGVDPARLDRLPLFSDLTAEERAEVAGWLRDVSVEAGTPLATQGENAYWLFVIEEGDAEVRKGGELIGTLGAGDVIGEIGLLATGTRTASVVATSPMRLVAMFVAEFRQLERRIPGLATSLRRMMGERAARASFQ